MNSIFSLFTLWSPFHTEIPLYCSRGRPTDQWKTIVPCRVDPTVQYFSEFCCIPIMHQTYGANIGHTFYDTFYFNLKNCSSSHSWSNCDIIFWLIVCILGIKGLKCSLKTLLLQHLHYHKESGLLTWGRLGSWIHSVDARFWPYHLLSQHTFRFIRSCCGFQFLNTQLKWTCADYSQARLDMLYTAFFPSQMFPVAGVLGYLSYHNLFGSWIQCGDSTLTSDINKAFLQTKLLLAGVFCFWHH